MFVFLLNCFIFSETATMFGIMKRPRKWRHFCTNIPDSLFSESVYCDGVCVCVCAVCIYVYGYGVCVCVCWGGWV